MTDIVDQYNSARLTPAPAQMLKDAIDEIIRLRAENEKLRAALKPFAKTDIAFYVGKKDDYVCTAVWFSLGQYRAAAAAIRESGDE